jgi:hypothetical protein
MIPKTETKPVNETEKMISTHKTDEAKHGEARMIAALHQAGARAPVDSKIIEPLEGEHVAAWFAEYVADKKRKRPMPNAEQCHGIAKIVNAHRNALKALKTIGSNAAQNAQINRIIDYTEQAGSEVETLQNTLKLLVQNWARFEENGLVHDNKTLKEAEKQRDFLAILNSYLFERTRRRTGRPYTSVFLPYGLFDEIVSALQAAGWNDVSRASEGPAMFVLSRCLEQLHRKPIKPATLARRFRAARAKTRRN